MNNHKTAWLGAYHDGELQGARLRQVEAHLSCCEECRAELEELRKLSALLQESPAPETLTQPERFVAQVALRLPRRPTQPAWKRTLEAGWQLAPVGLLGAWAFVEAAFIAAWVVLLGLRAGVGGELVAGLLPAVERETWTGSALNYLGADLSETSWTVLRWVGALGWTTILHAAILIGIGLLYWSWLASWWARQRHQASNGLG
jgi:hypothetical protein